MEEFSDWLAESGAGADVGQVEAFLTFLAGAPLESIDQEVVQAFLLEWCPRHLNLPADRSWEMCESVADFVLFLGWTGRLRGGTNRARSVARLAVGLADSMSAKMADPGNFGMSKSLFASIEGAESMSEQELLAAVQRRVEEHNALPLEERKAATDRFFAAPPEPFELPFLHVPPSESEVAAAVAEAALPAKVEALRGYLGADGIPLTAKSNLKLTDGRALVDLLDTGDEMDPVHRDKVFRTRSTASLRQLMYLIAVAKEAGAVRLVRNRLVPVKAWARHSPITKATKLFRTVLEYGVLSMMSRQISFFGEVNGLLDGGVVHWLAGLIAPGARAPFDAIVDLNQHVVLEEFGSADDQLLNVYVSGDMPASDVSRILKVLAMTGAIEWSDRVSTHDEWGLEVWRGGSITMTAFGRHVLPDYLPAAGMVLRTAPDLSEADLTDLIDMMDAQPQEQHSTMLASWQPALSVAERAGLISAYVAEAETGRQRLVGLRLLGMFDAELAEPHIRQLLDTDAAGHAAIWLLQHGLADGNTVGSFITPAILVDILGQLTDEPTVLCEQFLRSDDPEHMLEFFWRHPAPEVSGILDVLGSHLPDRALAKHARKAAMRHRSWMANGGFA
ncbi:hypothetical protein MANY_53980 [Mycolicibacterium anyangense]|uniref:Uncharacterized protein n=1 Tax=Mycolicibacterium anyangense TaxID=1431246 RepID=A0A6N4WLT5_9MYCO|nr:hypothetical protein MANY_53980 [Mycolicibacterium anyangense]